MKHGVQNSVGWYLEVAFGHSFLEAIACLHCISVIILFCHYIIIVICTPSFGFYQEVFKGVVFICGL